MQINPEDGINLFVYSYFATLYTLCFENHTIYGFDNKVKMNNNKNIHKKWLIKKNY